MMAIRQMDTQPADLGVKGSTNHVPSKSSVMLRETMAPWEKLFVCLFAILNGDSLAESLRLLSGE